MIMERGGRRRSRAADGYVPGHTVKNRMTVIARWGAIERKREFLKLLEAPFLRRPFLTHRVSRDPAGRVPAHRTDRAGERLNLCGKGLYTKYIKGGI